VIMARFVPIVRTFAPFVAGVGKMPYRKFLAYSVGGAVGWVTLCLSAGYFFGGFDIVKKNFEMVIVAIVAVSVLPMAVEFVIAWRKKAAAKKTADTSPSVMPLEAASGDAA
jgi:membrane-associated protein